MNGSGGTDIRDVIMGLQMLGGGLSIPRQIEAATAQQHMMRQLYKDYDPTLTEEQLNEFAPDPGPQWLSAGQANKPGVRGVFGKVLSGVGDLGSIIAAIAGRPVGAPRMDVGDLAAASRMRAERAHGQARTNLAQAIREGKSPQEIAALTVETGGEVGPALRTAFPNQQKPGTSLGALYYARNALDPDSPTFQEDYDRLTRTIDEIESGKKEAQKPPASLAQMVAARSNLDKSSPTYQQDYDRLTTQIKELQGLELEQRRAGGQAGADVQRQPGAALFEVAKQQLNRNVQKMGELSDIQNLFGDLTPRVAGVLTRNPALAASGIAGVGYWAKALQGDPDAAVVDQMMAFRNYLARLRDVGNLNTQEVEVWNAFMNAKNMTRDQFLNGMRTIAKIVDTARTRMQKQNALIAQGKYEEALSLGGDVAGSGNFGETPPPKPNQKRMRGGATYEQVQ